MTQCDKIQNLHSKTGKKTATLN